MSEKKGHSESGALLIFLGGVLALIFPVFPLTLTLLLRQDVGEWFENIGVWIIGSGSALAKPRLPAFILFFVAIGAVSTVVFGVVAVAAYTWVKRGRTREGGLAAVLSGVAMMASLHWIPGIITMVGGALCYNSNDGRLEEN